MSLIPAFKKIGLIIQSYFVPSRTTFPSQRDPESLLNGTLLYYELQKTLDKFEVKRMIKIDGKIVYVVRHLKTRQCFTLSPALFEFLFQETLIKTPGEIRALWSQNKHSA